EQVLDDAVETADLAQDEVQVLALRAIGHRAVEVLDARGDAGERIADLVRDARGESSQRRQPVLTARMLLGAPERRQVDEGGDRAVDGAALVAQQRRGEA